MYLASVADSHQNLQNLLPVRRGGGEIVSDKGFSYDFLPPLDKDWCSCFLPVSCSPQGRFRPPASRAPRPRAVRALVREALQEAPPAGRPPPAARRRRRRTPAAHPWAPGARRPHRTCPPTPRPGRRRGRHRSRRSPRPPRRSSPRNSSREDRNSQVSAVQSTSHPRYCYLVSIFNC